MNVVAGMGWIAGEEYGCAIKELRRSYRDIRSLRSDLQDAEIFSHPVKGFGRYDLVSKMTCCVAALALHDAEIPYSEGRKRDIGILGTNTDGCLQSNLDFYRDFVDNGRKRGRANLFVSTLPSIPVAQAAIYFECRGPLLYMTFPPKRVPSLLRESNKMILRGDAPAMLAVSASEESALCFAVVREEDASRETAIGIEEAIGVAERQSTLDEMLRALSRVRADDPANRVPRADAHEKGRH